MIACQAKAKCRVIDHATGKIVRETDWQNNLVFDSGLNSLANGVNSFPNFFNTCKVGSSNSANVIQSGAITFTQTGTTITASGNFFTSAMTGAILKYGSGSGGQEQYITYVSPTSATSNISFSQASPVAGVVYLVQQTALVGFLYLSDTYQTGPSNCGTTYTASAAVMQRTYNFANQSGTYNVNEIGYSSDTSNNGNCNGRIVLNSTVTVSATQFLQVVIIMTYNCNPATQTAVANVGTNINTAGTAIYTNFDFNYVDTNGNNAGSLQGFGTNMMDECNGTFVGLLGSAPTLPSSISSSQSAGVATIYQLGQAHISNAGQAVGVGLASFTYSVTTAGESCYGFIFGGQQSGSAIRSTLQISFTTPQVLPVGTFSGTFSFAVQFSRTLTN